MNTLDLDTLKEQLQQSESKYRSLLDSISDVVHVIDEDFRILLANRAMIEKVREFGIESDVVGKNLFEICSFLGDEIRREYISVFETGEPMVTEETHYFNDETVIFEVRKVPVIEEGKVDRVLTFVRDITERKKSEVAVRESREQYFTLVQQSPEIIVSLDENGRFLSFNPMA